MARWLGIFLLVLCLSGSGWGYDHSEDIEKYEGSKSCIDCHEDVVKEVFASFHYRCAGRIDDIVNAPNVTFGKSKAYNDFCGSVFFGPKPINWIGKAILKKAPEGKEGLKGRVVAQGCSICHIGLGRIPSSQVSEEQLENIDCFICHLPGYTRKNRVLKKGPEGFYRVPDQKIKYAEVVKKLRKKPLKDNCLTCHAYSGGGPGFKRPNLDPSLMGKVSRDMDVHMARGMDCVVCHKGRHHRFAVKAVDTWLREEGERPSCEGCHGDHPHEREVINQHVKTVACQTCHIPTFARVFPTDMKRDWRGAAFNDEVKRWGPEIEFAKDVIPHYTWWDGESREAYLYPAKVKLQGDKFFLFKPVGSIDDPHSRIYPFKYHEAVVPLSEEGIPVPIKVGIVFATGDTKAAIARGAKESGLTFKGKFVTMVRFMALNHGVVPKEKALRCKNCHGAKRLNWRALGYKGDPRRVGSRSPE